MKHDEWLGTSTLGAVRLNDALARAENAEAKLADALVRSLKLIDERDTLRARLGVAADRAERAERVLADEREWYAVAKRGLDESNARLAELVSELVDWSELPENCDVDQIRFLHILMKYEKPERDEGGEHG